MNVLLMGPPGSGKGTQGQRLAERLGVAHVAAGDLLRAEVKAGTPLGEQAGELMSQGRLVPDELVIELLRPAVEKAAADGGFVLDGFPRSVRQAEQARELAEAEGMAADAAVYLDAPRDELTARLLARAEKEGRSDDNEQVITERLRVFDEATQPLVEHYRERGLLHVVDALGRPEQVTAAILAALGVGADGTDTEDTAGSPGIDDAAT